MSVAPATALNRGGYVLLFELHAPEVRRKPARRTAASTRLRMRWRSAPRPYLWPLVDVAATRRWQPAQTTYTAR